MTLDTRHVLVVDDGQDFREVLCAALTRRGFVSHPAPDIATGLALARRHRPWAGVVDLRLNDESGLRLLETLCAEMPAIRLVMLTGFGSISTAVQAMKLGAVHYLTKPTGVEDILAAWQGEASALEEEAKRPTTFTVTRLEWEHIHRVLSECGGNVSEAARRLGLHRRTLQRKLKKRPGLEELR